MSILTILENDFNLNLDPVFKRLTIYKKENCMPCKMTVKKLIESYGFKEENFETIMIDDPEIGEETTEYIKTLFDVSSAPLIVIETICKKTGDVLSITHWTGFNVPALKAEVEDQLELFLVKKEEEEVQEVKEDDKEKTEESNSKQKPLNLSKKLFVYTSGNETLEQNDFISKLQEEVGDLVKVKLIDPDFVGYYENLYGQSFVVVVQEKNLDTKAYTLKFATSINNFEDFLSENFYLDVENFEKHQ